MSASFRRFCLFPVLLDVWGFLSFLICRSCYNSNCCSSFFAVSVLASSSVFAGVVSVGFSGSRSLSLAASSALSSLLPLAPAGVRVSVGCAKIYQINNLTQQQQR